MLKYQRVMDVDHWQPLWSALEVLDRRARDLRRLSQEEPLLTARPDYPSARVGRSHDQEVRDVFADLARAFADTRRLLPDILPEDFTSPGVASDEAPKVLAARVERLETMVSTLAREAFEPVPPLPKHAPPYLVTAPGHDLPSTKALVLGNSIATAVASLRNALVAVANAGPSRSTVRPAPDGGPQREG